MANPPLVAALCEHGFSLNEARAYEMLLRNGPSTGYEVAQRAQIPRSAVYASLRRLVAQGAARSVAGSPERFVAAPADGLLSLLRSRFEASTGALELAIREIAVEPPVPDAYSVRGYDRVLEEARRLIDEADTSLVVSGWPREVASLSNALADAVRRGVRTVLFSHAAMPADVPGTHFNYGLDERALEAFWKHRLVLVADDRRTLVGAAERRPTDTAVVSETPAIAELATSQVTLDITLLAQRY
ncbi:MAG: TrmB family transcriptional regulator, partial [Deltaproteobacteria bacterium]|nr:TrmB family transcriptional regulator [Deltaproteobacteria bacterium]